MKKYISILLVAILCSSILAGCGGSDNSGKKPAEETQEQTAQPEGTEQAQPSEDAAQADAAQEDAAKDEAQVADNTANSGAYLVCVMDAETMKPIPNVRVQFCSDSMCRMGKTDENGLAKFEVDPGTYTVSSKLTPEHILSI